MGFPGGSAVKNPPVMQKLHETQVPSLDQEDPLEEGVAIHSSILAWRIPWREEPGGLQSIGSQRVRHSRSDLAYTHAHKIYIYDTCICAYIYLYIWHIYVCIYIVCISFPIILYIYKIVFKSLFVHSKT